MRRGFSLLELLLVLALLVGLTQLAWPSYQQIMRTSYRQQAGQWLLEIAVAVESYRLDHGELPSHLRQLPVYATGSPLAHRFTFQLVRDGDGYQLQASAIGPQQQDRDCLELMLRHTGERVSSPSSSCWPSF